MPNKKSNAAAPAPENNELVQHVDEMLSVEPVSAKPASPKPEAKMAPAAAASGASSAPELPAKLLKTIKIDDKPTAKPPLKIKLNDTTDEAVKVSVIPSKKEIEASWAAPVETALPVQAVPTTRLDDTATDKAVDDIVKHEGDTLLALEDARTERIKHPPTAGGFKAKLGALLRSKKLWAVIIILIIIIFAVPFTRYKILGLVLKKSITVTVLDSKTATPVSNADIQLAGHSVKTDADGSVSIKAGIGPQMLTVSKQYYATGNQKYFVKFSANSPANIRLVATGRLVPITLHNKLTGKALAGVQIKVLHTTVKTNNKGEASIALPAKSATEAVELSLVGYNTFKTTLQVTDEAVKANQFTLTPAGQIYFLSLASGTLDVDKVNLDGGGQKTVLEGTGKEDAKTTMLVASRDWHYVVLKAQRDADRPSLYLLDTSSDKLTEFDDSNSDFTVIGWQGHSFVYELTRNDKSKWQSGSRQIKSYDAENQQLNQLDQNQAEGNSSSYGYQDFNNFYTVNNTLVYATQWFNGGTGYDISSKSASIRGVQANGQNKKDYQTFAANASSSVSAQQHSPQAVYFAVTDGSSGNITYYDYQDQAVKTATIAASDFTKTYPDYLTSASSKLVFWSELRDGKNGLFTGDALAANPRRIPSSGDYLPFGWYGDNYLLVTSGSTVYIMLSSGSQPLALADFYKPSRSYQGYGYGGF